MESKLKIDNLELPSEINVMKFISARAQEIAMTVADSKKKHPKLMSQQLPFHMRRRSVSHNIKRLPRRLRDKLSTEAEKIQAKKTKRPSRKYRRRPSNLLSEYERRSRKNIWLETHIWFAKRFKMVDKWGYKLPLHSNDKSFRACYRATIKHCLLQDISYYGCIEILGPEEQLLDGLKQMTSDELGLTFSSKMYLSGTREGYTVLYHPKTYPYKAIGPVSFLWNPKSITKDKLLIRQIWIFCHPTIYSEVGNLLASMLNLVPEKSIEVATSLAIDDSEPQFKKRKTKGESEIIEKTDSVQEIPSLGQNPVTFRGNDNIEMNYLKDQLVRFRLTGPLSQTILNHSICMAENISTDNTSFWWKEYYKHNLEEFEGQKNVWQKHSSLLSSAQLALGTIIGLTVRDPRFSLPIKRTKIALDSLELSKNIPNELIQFPAEVCHSPIWDKNIRDSVKDSMVKTNEVNRLRKEHFNNTGEKLGGLGEKESKIPLLVIQNSKAISASNNNKGGCDIIIPSGWAMPFWISLIYRECRAGGLREEESMGMEGGVPVFPQGYPDSDSGRLTALDRRKELYDKHFKYPPNKRPNFEKLGVISPFFPLWKDLVSQWSIQNGCLTVVNDIYVVRNRTVLQALSKLVERPNVEDLENLAINVEEKKLNEALVFLRIKCQKGGSGSEFTSISLPLDSEVERRKVVHKLQGPIETFHKVTAKEKSKTKNSKEFTEKLPDGSGLLDSCDRKIIGYTITGRFSFAQAQNMGNGFCSYVGLLNLLKLCAGKCETTVLLREQHSLKYHYATINVPIVF